MGADRETEEVEHIPWAMLADELEASRRPSVAKIAAGVVVVVMVAIIAVRSMRTTTGTVVEGAPEPIPVTTEADQSDAVAPAAAPSDTTPPAPQPSLYSEADLMAFVPSADERVVAVRAEWFVMDYFTSTSASSDNGPEPTGYSWVDWARATEVVAVSPTQFDVTVVFRTLVEEGGAYRPTDARTVVVPVELDSADGVSVAGLPRPGQAALSPEIVTEDEAWETAPDSVHAEALEVAEAWGDAPEVIGTQRAGDGWQVVVEVGDVSALRWRLVVPVGEE